MPSVVLTGGRTKRRRSSMVKLPRLPKRKRPRLISVKNPAGSAEAERAALQTLAQRFQRGNLGGWKSAVHEAAKSAAVTGAPATATNLVTGHTVHAVPLSGGASRKRKRSTKSSSRKSKRMRGGFLPALIPIIAAAIGAIPGIAGTAIGIANLKEQQRQYNEQMKLQREQMDRLYGRKQ